MRAGWDHIAGPPRLVNLLGGNGPNLKLFGLRELFLARHEPIICPSVLLNQRSIGVECLDVVLAISAPDSPLGSVVNHSRVATGRMRPAAQPSSHAQVADIDNGDAAQISLRLDRWIFLVAHGAVSIMGAER